MIKGKDFGQVRTSGQDGASVANRATCRCGGAETSGDPGSGPHAPGGSWWPSDGNGLRFGRRCPVGGRLQNLCREGEARDNPLIVHIGHLCQLRIWSRSSRRRGSCWSAALAWTARWFFPTGDSGPEGDRRTGNGGSADALSSGGAGVASGKRRAGGRASANRSGRPSPEADHVWEDLGEAIDGLLDAGPTGVGLESTVVDVTGSVPLLLRPGGVTLEELREAVGEVRVDPGLEGDDHPPRSPGMKYRHYAPEGEMWLVEGSGETLVRRIRELAEDARRAGRRVGLLITEENLSRYRADRVVALGRRSDPESVARNLYRALREMDRAGVTTSWRKPSCGRNFPFGDEPPTKAAGGRVIRAEGP